jgi:hypothetical protein
MAFNPPEYQKEYYQLVLNMEPRIPPNDDPEDETFPQGPE